MPNNVPEDVEELNSLPVRSHAFEKSNTAKEQNGMPKIKTSAESKIASPDKKTESAPAPDMQKLKEANEIKDVGNRHVKFQQYDLAIKEYTRAIDLCPNEAVFYANRALCFLKLKNYGKCIEDCDQAIAIDKLAVKAYYRRMQANESLGNYMDALKDCTSALTIEPRNAETKKSLDRINECLRKNLKSQNGPNFSPDSKNFVEIHPIDKPSYKRSSKPLRRVPIADVIGPKATTTFQNLKISDEDIDKLFNSNCGPFVEVKKNTTPTVQNKPIVPLTEPERTSKVTSAQELKIESNESTASTITITNSKEVTETVKLSNSITSNKEDNLDQKPPTKKKDETTTVPQPRPLPTAPSTTAQFYTNWKELPDKQKYEYLRSISVNNLRKVLGTGFDSDTLTDCLRILHDFYLINEDATSAATLLEISRNEEVRILSLLMSTEDKKVLSEILDTLVHKELINEETLQAIKTNFHFV